MMQQKDNPLPEMLSILFGEGWCYFLTDDSLDSCEKKKTVNLVHFQSPSKAQLFSNSFSAFAMITFVIDTSLESFWNEEILITVCSLVGPKLSASETLVPVWKQRIIRSSISKLKELVEKICDERFDCNELKDEDIFKVEVNVKNEFPDEPALQELPIKDLIKTNESSKAEENCPGSITDTQSQESDEDNENLSSPFCPNEPGQDVDIAEEDASTEYNTDGNALAEDILETSPSGNAEKSGIESVRCAFCSNTFADKRKLRAHVRLQHRVPAAPHHPSSDNGLSQNQQPKTEQQPSFFKQPRKRIYKRCYTETPGGLECAECSQVLPTKMKLHLHRKKFHISTNVKCDQCNKIYTSGKFLARHKEKSHLSEPAREICDQCPRSFKNRKSLLSHKTSYHNSGRSVAEQRKSYPSHDATIPESERTCHLCGKISRHLASLKRHFLYVHERSKQFKCLFCSETLTSASKLSEHKMIHTGELKCFICQKNFKFKHSLREHVRSHEGIRAYKCSFCTSDFLDNRTLKKHTLKVHGRETKGGICKELSSKIAAMGGPVRVVNMD